MFAREADGMIYYEYPLSKYANKEELVNKSINVDLNLLAIDSAKIYKYNWTYFDVVSIPFKNETNRFWYAYIHDSKIFSFLVTSNDLEIELTDTEDNKTIFNANFNNGYGIVDDNGFLAEFEDIFEDTATSSICDCHGVDSSINHQYDKMEDCGQYSYQECMLCGNDVCDQDYRCDNARTWTGPAFVVGLMATCALNNM